MGPYVDIYVKLVLHFFLGIRINVTLVSEKVDCATCNMQLVNKLRRKQCVQTANVIYQSGQKTLFRLHICRLCVMAIRVVEFSYGDIKLERFLPKNHLTKMKL